MTFCEQFGHTWEFMKAYGKTYMECERCHTIRQLNSKDLERELKRSQGTITSTR